MSFVPKYQWLTEKKDNACGNACDVVQIDATAEKKFQVAFTPTILLNQNFDGNNIGLPMEKIWVGLGSLGSGSGTGEYYGITFDIDLSVENHFINSFSFFYEGQAYCYIFTYDNSITPAYEIQEIGYFKLVKLRTAGGVTRYVNTFNEYMNAFGISAIDNGGNSITVYGFPENTQVTTGDIAPYNTVITEGVGSRSINLSNFLPYNNMACYFNISSLNLTPGATCTPAIFTEPITVPANKRMIFTVNYTNNLAFDFDIELRIRDNTFTLIDTVIVSAIQGTNTATFNYETGGSSASYYFDFTLSDIACGFLDELFGFCFDLIKVETIEKLDTITAVGCTTQTVPFTEEYNNLYNSLITMDTGSLPNGLITTGKWKLVLTDDESNTWTSITYETIDGTNCLIRNLIRFTWTSDCLFSEIDYANLPFTNDVYIKGYSVSQPFESKDRVINTLSTGALELIYDYSIEKTEFNIGIYTANFFKTLQRAFLHKTITLNGVSYKLDSDSKLTKKPEGFKYSAKIDLVESGTEVIVSKCCC